MVSQAHKEVWHLVITPRIVMNHTERMVSFFFPTVLDHSARVPVAVECVLASFSSARTAKPRALLETVHETATDRLLCVKRLR